MSKLREGAILALLYTAIGIGFIALVLIIVYVASTFKDASSYLIFGIFLFTIIIIGVIIFRYLEGKRKSSISLDYSSSKNDISNEIFFTKLESIEQLLKKNDPTTTYSGVIEDIQEKTNKFFKEEHKQKLLEATINSIENELASNITNKIDSLYQQKLINNTYYLNATNTIKHAIDRLEKEIGNLSRKANLNLAIGSTVTLVAVFILWLKVVNSDFELSSASSFFSHFIPRLSVVIFIEIFAFFFLRLYKSNLIDIKYYQNELTNAQFKFAALKASMASNQENTVYNNILNSLSLTERNFILKKGESTVDLERIKYQEQIDSKLIDLLNSMLNKENITGA